MPELPEVETIRLGLSKKLIGLVVKDIEVLNPKTFIGDPKLVISQKVLNIFRRAKVLGIELNGDLTLLIHLKMSGQLIWKSKGEKLKAQSFVGGHPTQDMTGEMPNRSTRVIFSFDDGSKLFFNDQRKFGWIKVTSSVILRSDTVAKDPLRNWINSLGRNH